MHLNIAEVPAAPFLVEAVPPLVILCGLLFALGCAMLISYFARAILNTLAGIFSFVPFVGGITASIIHSLENAIVSALGTGIAKIEKNIGHQWHNLSRVLSHFWGVMERMAQVSWELAKISQGIVTLGDVRHWLRDLRHAINRALHIGHQALTKVVHIERTITVHLPRHLAKRLHAVEHAIAVDLPAEIKTARDLAREAEDGVKRLWDWTRNLANNPAIVAAIATAIAALGLVGIDLLKCSKADEINKTRGCSMWGALDDLLGLVALGIAAMEYDEMVHEAQQLTGGAITAFKDVFGLVE